MSPRALFFASVFALLSVHVARGETVHVATGVLEKDYAWTLFSFTLEGFGEAAGVRVTALPSGKELASQAERRGDAVLVHWLVPELEKGETGRWKIELLDKAPAAAPRVRIRRGSDTEHAVEVDGAEFTRYVHGDGAPKPYFYPIIGPTGQPITRAYPIKRNVPGEDQDHPHHRSLWFTHGKVNGVDFWSESSSAGLIRQRFLDPGSEGRLFGRLVTTNDWVSRAGKKVLEERRDVRIIPLERGEVLMDFDILLVATEGPVTFGDDKEGSFGIRIAESMKEKRGGAIVNSRGQKGESQAWGKPAEWVDCSGPLGDEKQVAGVAMLHHPESFRHPTHWHVRGYGLFAANPFGYSHFYRDHSKDGSHLLERDGALRFRYRLYFHHGGAEEARVEAVYRSFADPPVLHAEEKRNAD
jgi:hypothetical protein